MRKIYVIINRQHSLLAEQKTLLEKEFGQEKMIFVKTPARGLTTGQQRRLAMGLANNASAVVFVSPVPLVLAELMRYTAFTAGYHDAVNRMTESVGRPVKQPFLTKIYLFVNDHREKKELPNGRIISAVASTGWQLEELTWML